MRWRIALLMLAGMIGGRGSSGQDLARADRGDRTIQRNWPDDGASNPEPPKTKWSGSDAVGLQFRDREAASSVVSVSALRIPPAALKEMRKSDKALLAGDVRGSAEHLEKMLGLAPELPTGHNSLGARYVVLGEYDKALDEFQKAVDLQANYRLAVDNIAVVYCLQHKYAEGERAARRALQIQPEAATSKYLLGSILVNEGKLNEEAARLLVGVEQEYPRARLFLAKISFSRGELQQTAAELRAYLKSPQASDNGVAEQWLTQVENELGSQGSSSAMTQK